MKRAFVVFNPASGQSEPDELQARVRELAASHGWEYNLHAIDDGPLEDALGGARQAGFDLVVAAGGDGTVSAVASGLVNSGIPIAIVPLGTGNVLAQDLGIPVELDAALELAFGEHAVRELDALCNNDRLFLMNLSVGTTAEVMRETSSEEKKRFGFLAYLWNGARQLLGQQPHAFTVLINGQERRIWASEAFVVNSSALGSPLLRLGPEVRPDDGHIEVVLVYARTFVDYVRLIWSLLVSRRRPGRRFKQLTTGDAVILRTDEVLPVQADGEFIGETPVEVRILPRAMMVVVPPNWQELADE